MWKNKASLLQGLKEQGITEAAETTKDNYKKLLLAHRPWWELLRLLKLPKLDTGLGLSVPKVFAQPNMKPVEQKSLRKPGVQCLAGDSQALGALSKEVSGPSLVSQADDNGNRSTHQGSDKAAGDQADPPFPSGGLPAAREGYRPPSSSPRSDLGLERPQKKRKVAEQEGDSDDEHFYRPLTPLGSDDEIEESDWVCPKTLRCHSQLSHQLQRLESGVNELQPDEAHALNGLLEAIVELQGTSNMARVVEALSAKIQVGASF